MLAPDERLVCVIAFGYGAEQGEAHESRPMREVYRADRALPEWVRPRPQGGAARAHGDEPAALPLHAPAGRYRSGGEPGAGSYSHVDLGIVKYHFQLGAGPRELPLGGVSRRFRTQVC